MTRVTKAFGGLVLALLSLSTEAARGKRSIRTTAVNKVDESAVRVTHDAVDSSQKANSLPPLHRASLATIPVRMYSSDCWQKRPISGRHPAVLAQLDSSEYANDYWGPGAGMDPNSIQPFQTVVKDGWFPIDCGKDYLYNVGDAFGDNRHDYAVGESENVSIVHYENHVDVSMREPMTHEVCFKFCRTIPEMLTFGITNGRNCYCSPFYKPMADDHTICDLPCDGNPTEMCGGKSKSTVFEMHSCADTKAELNETGAKATEILPTLDKDLADVSELYTDLMTAAEEHESALGQVGDPSAVKIMHSAKITAGELEDEVVKGRETEKKLKAAVAGAAEILGDGIDGMEMLKAEALRDDLVELLADAEDSIEHLDSMVLDIHPKNDNATGAAKQYYDIMYFADESKKDFANTCTGIVAAHPKTKVTEDECAATCDHLIHTCAGYQYYHPVAKGHPNLCFLFTKFTEVKTYPTCAGHEFYCKVKLAKYEGINITPKTGCKKCLEVLASSDTCPAFREVKEEDAPKPRLRR